MVYTTAYQSPLGEIGLTSDGDNLTGLWLPGQTHFAQTITTERISKPNLLIFSQTRQWLDDYFSLKKPSITKLSLKPAGSKFRLAAWTILQRIPYGATCTYGEIAHQLASQFGKTKMSAQAVGGAVGHNPISIIIPCHRVLGAHQRLTGYAGGLDLKVKLLQLEGIATTKLIYPSLKLK